MKKILILFFFVINILFVSCDLLDEETILRLTSDPAPPEVKVVHVAVLDGDTILSKTSMDVDRANNGGIAEIYISPGNEREIIIWGENANGEGIYFGSDIVDIISGEKNIVKIDMQPFIIDAINDAFNISNNLNVIMWDEIPGVIGYRLENDDVFNLDFHETYYGGNNRYDLGTYYQCNLRVKAISIFEIESVYSNYFSY